MVASRTDGPPCAIEVSLSPAPGNVSEDLTRGRRDVDAHRGSRAWALHARSGAGRAEAVRRLQDAVVLAAAGLGGQWRGPDHHRPGRDVHDRFRDADHGGTSNPFAVGGLVGSLLFAGYMLTQFPGGHIGDRLGHRTVIVIAIVWAGVATLLTGLMTALIGFVALRVITGLGAGLFYSNDRSVIAAQSPFEKRSLGMGFVITGLAIGITLAMLLAAPLIDLGSSVFGAGDAWRMPFLVLGLGAVLIGVRHAPLLPQPDRRARVPLGVPAGARAGARVRGRLLLRRHGDLHHRHRGGPVRSGSWRCSSSGSPSRSSATSSCA